MPRLQNVTRAEIQAAQDATDDALHTMIGLHERIDKGYCDDIADPTAIARHFTALSRAALSLVTDMLIKLALKEKEAEIEASFRQRIP